MTSLAPYRLHKSLGYQMSLTTRIQEKRLEDGLRTLGLTRIQWCILLAVGNEKLRNPSDIAAFVGIDSHNIDDINQRARPVHTILLGAGIPICEHLTRLGDLPAEGFHFTAAPPKIVGMGTFAVRAFAQID